MGSVTRPYTRRRAPRAAPTPVIFSRSQDSHVVCTADVLPAATRPARRDRRAAGRGGAVRRPGPRAVHRRQRRHRGHRRGQLRRGAAGRDRDGHQRRDGHRPLGDHQRQRVVPRDVAAARLLPRDGRTAGLQEVRAGGRDRRRGADGDRGRAARGGRSQRDDLGDRRRPRRRHREGGRGSQPQRQRGQEPAAGLAQPVQLRAAAAGRHRIRELRVRRAAVRGQRHPASDQLPDRRQHQHPEGPRRASSAAGVRGDGARGQGRDQRLCPRVRADDGARLQRDHAVGHQHLPGCRRVSLPPQVLQRLSVLLPGASYGGPSSGHEGGHDHRRVRGPDPEGPAALLHRVREHLP